jgi:uncharacterized protein (TIRG00374 family)
MSVFGAYQVLTAVESANLSALATVAALGILIQVLRAERARRLIAGGYEVTLAQSYRAMVVGHGIGDLLPLAPGGPVLRSVLLERYAKVPVAFSAGAFVMEGVLDGLGIAVLSGMLLIVVPVSSSMRQMLVASLAPVLFVIVLLLVSRRLVLRRAAPAHEAKPTLVRQLTRQVAAGLNAAISQGPAAAVVLLAMTVLITVCSAAQIELLLRAFGIAASPQSLLILVVLTLAAGSIPVKLPGSGTVTAAAVMPMAGIHGAGVAGYLLVSRAIFSSQTTVLALLLLGWGGFKEYFKRAAFLTAVSSMISASKQRSLTVATRVLAVLSNPSAAATSRRRDAGATGLEKRLAAVQTLAVQSLPVFAAAFVLRLVALALSGNTFDPDEFVILGLGRAVAHGAVPYRDLTYFHPPGMLYLMAALQPLTHLWWPVSRLLMLSVDSVTAVLVWRVGRDLYGEKTARVAGLLYVVSPLALISATRVGPDPIITMLGMLGFVQLMRRRSRSGPILAGLLLGLAVWAKYPALIFLPVYLLAAPRHACRVMAAFGLTLVTLFAPLLLADARAFYSDTVLWQMSHRGSADLLHRLSSVGAYWLGLNFLAVVALLRRPSPLWLRVGFCSGAVFLFTSQAYYHYFVPIAPFAALIAAPLVQPFFEWSRRLVVIGALAAGAVWALDVGIGPPVARLFVTASSLSAAQQTAAIIDEHTPPESRILSDELEYSLLADRKAAANYFWNMGTAVSARTLEQQLPNVSAVVQTTDAEAGFPAGFADYLKDLKVREVRTGASTVWLLSPRSVH